MTLKARLPRVVLSVLITGAAALALFERQGFDPAALESQLDALGKGAPLGFVTAVRYGLLGLSLLALIAFAPRLVRRPKGSAAQGWLPIGALRHRLGSSTTPIMVGVRNPGEFTGPLGYIAGARNIPLGEAPAADPVLEHRLDAR